MDVIVKGDGAVPPRPLGRDTAATINAKPDWEPRIAAAPHVFSGASAAVAASPRLWNYCPGGFDQQWIGMCVGKGAKNACATLLRIPPGCVHDAADPAKDSRPLPTVRLSGLYCYLNARRKGLELGMALGGPPNDPNGGGAVVAYALLALEQHGVVTEGDYPDTEANQARCADAPLPPGFYKDGDGHRVLRAARITTRAQYLDFLAKGYPVVDGVPIAAGWFRTADDGRFSLDGGAVGGHCTLKVGFDKRTNRLYVRNSWMRWGARTADPEFNHADPCMYGNAEGFSNVGYCALDQYCDLNLTDDAFRSGRTDAFVITAAPGGFAAPAPLVVPHSNVDVFV